MSSQKIATKGPVIRDPFAVIPVKPEAVEMKRDSRGLVHLRLAIETAGLKKRVADLLRYDNSKKLELDEYGSFCFEQINGERTLDEIVRSMCERFGLEREDARMSVVLFMKKLMVLNMVVLKVPMEAADE